MSVRKTLSDEQLEYFRKWRENNKDRVKQYKQKWCDGNRDKIVAYNNKIKALALTKITCECGSVISSITMNRHKRSKKHKLFISEAEAQ